MDTDTLSGADQIACPYCKELVKRDALICKHCRSDLTVPLNTPKVIPSAMEGGQHSAKPEGSLWIPIVGLVLGIISFICFFDDSDWDVDTVTGVMLFAIIALVLGIIGVTKQKVGRGMSIASIVLGGISIFLSFGVISTM